jgi:hypothetical protein
MRLSAFAVKDFSVRLFFTAKAQRRKILIRTNQRWSHFALRLSDFAVNDF